MATSRLTEEEQPRRRSRAATTTSISEEEYYELLEEARDSIPPIGLDRIFQRMLQQPRSYAWKYSYLEWFVGPWLEHHRILDELEKEYGDG